MRPLRELDEEQVDVGGVPTRFLLAGEGRPMVLLHADGDNRLDWRWVLERLATHHRVYAPDLPGFGGTGTPPDCSPEFFEGFVRDFLDALGLDSSILVGNSLGGLAALRVALHAADRVSALCLVGSAGLGGEVSLALRQLTMPGVGEAAIWWGRTGVGAAQRLLLRLPLLFGNPTRVPPLWLAEQYRLAQLPGFLDTTLAALRAQVEPKGQKQVLVNDLSRLTVPTLVVWGGRDLVVPVSQARTAARLLPSGSLEVIANTGHLPHVEQPEKFVTALSGFVTASRG
ncbi:MAG: alpha/beta fold hydrolase [Actinomycetota bacterium]|nr:alpha/beta fold hydrolase [Actinomycetota bacterium]